MCGRNCSASGDFGFWLNKSMVCQSISAIWYSIIVPEALWWEIFSCYVLNPIIIKGILAWEKWGEYLPSDRFVFFVQAGVLY